MQAVRVDIVIIEIMKEKARQLLTGFLYMEVCNGYFTGG